MSKKDLYSNDFEKLLKRSYKEERYGKYGEKRKCISEIIHTGLNTHKIIQANDRGVLHNKEDIYLAQLEDKWIKLQDKWDKQQEKMAIEEERQSLQNEADKLTQEAIQILKDTENILLYTLDIDDTIDWNALKSKAIFSKLNPNTFLAERLAKLDVPKLTKVEYPQEVNKKDYEPKFSLTDKLFGGKNKKIQEAANAYQKAIQRREELCKKVDEKNESLKEGYNEAIQAYEKSKENIIKQIEKDVEKWNKEREEFEKNQVEANKKVDELKNKYMSGDEEAVLEYSDLVLNNSQYPDFISKDFELDYNPDNKILIIEYSFPSYEDLPTLNEVKVVKTDFKDFHISDVVKRKLYDTTLYNITLRSIHEIFEADAANAIDAVSFNGWVSALNTSTGKRESYCILSIQAKKEEFLEINLRNVNPKDCFKNLKGVGSSKLSGLTPIQPILQINKTDKRFTSHYDVADGLDSSTNLAAMDWEDFEHLIREVFAKEFSSNGGEVKVTQASKDGGVDAIAFDPDPIRGGKIVIQAKRYTNTVGVSAVRDLYGTVMNEGATKGILVTTADYGPDAYDFVKNKPITLLSGANLLYLLEKHGHKARIDLKEAKMLSKEK